MTIIVDGSTLRRLSTNWINCYREVYGITVIRHSYACVKPWTFIANVMATQAQMDAFSAEDDDAKVEPVR